jgi:hypothetical protein
MIDARYRCVCGHGEKSHLTRRANRPTSCTRPCSCTAYVPDPTRMVWVERTGELEDKYMPEPNSGCWLWIGAIDDKGYGRFGMAGTRRQTLAHRAVYEKHVGPIPEGMFLCHKCDTPLCVNPRHMFVGSPSENMQDMVAKGRAPVGVDTEKKLTVDQVREIRTQAAKGVNFHELARRFPVGRTSIRAIVRRRTWKNVA